jgi:serine phosphatase RsbU (regulator of sigma subunit)
MELRGLAGELLPALDEAFPTLLVPVLSTFLAKHVGAERVGLLLIDYDLELLQRLDPEGGDEPVESIPVEQAPWGRAFTAQTSVTVPSDSVTTLYLPVSLRAERLGVLEVVLPGAVEAEVIRVLGQVAVTLAYVVRAAAAYSDIFERARRRRPLALASEMQWGLLPVRAFAAPEFALAGQLVPAYEVGGDNFDYAIDADEVTVVVTDAMGHGLRASMLTALAVNALRCARRAGGGLTEQARAADRALFEQFGGEQFVTALLLNVHLPSGRAHVVGAGHPLPYRLRQGTAQPVPLDAQLPLGMFEATTYEEQEIDLRPGDRMLFVSDGVLEATSPQGEEFGETRLEGAVLATATHDPHESVRMLVRSLLSYQQGSLRDDATLLCFDWYGPSQRP